MRLAIVATPPLALVSILTAGLALRPQQRHTVSPRAEPTLTHCTLAMPHLAKMCGDAHALRVSGWVTGGGASRVHIAGPIIYTDVTTDTNGHFALTIPVSGDLCSLLPAPASFIFSDDAMTVAYRIGFD